MFLNGCLPIQIRTRLELGGSVLFVASLLVFMNRRSCLVLFAAYLVSITGASNYSQFAEAVSFIHLHRQSRDVAGSCRDVSKLSRFPTKQSLPSSSMKKYSVHQTGSWASGSLEIEDHKGFLFPPLAHQIRISTAAIFLQWTGHGIKCTPKERC